MVIVQFSVRTKNNGKTFKQFREVFRTVHQGSWEPQNRSTLKLKAMINRLPHIEQQLFAWTLAVGMPNASAMGSTICLKPPDTRNTRFP
jgi:hypothetical protein